MQALLTAELWAAELGELLLTEGEPQVGDLLFLALNEEEDAETPPNAEEADANQSDTEQANTDQSDAELPDEAAPRADHVAILVEIDEDGCLRAALGDGTVQLILVDPETIVGYVVLPEKEEAPDEPERALPAIRFHADFYALAPEGCRLLRVSADLPEDESYCFDGQPLKLSEAKGYLLDADAQATFVAFIPNTYSLEEVAALLTAEPVERQTLEYSADVNEDGVVNIADANAVYQMVQNGCGYYTDEQISPEARLRLCYNDLRDLDAILDIINGVPD